MAYEVDIQHNENPSEIDERSISEGFFITINRFGLN